MTATTLEFKLLGDQVLVSMTGSAVIHQWDLDGDERRALAAIDQLAWGRADDATPDAVCAAGMALRARLDEIPDLAQRLQGGFAAPAAARNQLVLRVVSPDVEQVPFEVLFDEPSGTFAALDARWSLVRLPADCDAHSVVVTMPPRIRLLAVVAALGIDPVDELVALRDTVDAADGIDVDVRVLTNRQSGVDLAEAAGWEASFVTGELAADAIVEQVSDFGPQLVHLFCHGTSQPPHVQIGLKDDLASVDLGANVLQELIPGGISALGPWLVTLNCCEGAGAGTDTSSLAAALARAGFPAVVGMRAPVDATVAHRFCGDLYKVVLGELGALADAGSQPRPLDWGALLQQPRRRLVTLHGGVGDVAGRQKEWTMPLLYLGSDGFLLRGRPTAPEISYDAAQVPIVQLATADTMEHSGTLDATTAEQLRAASLATLYP